MAKKNKQHKLTEDDEKRLEQHFQQVCDQGLRQWYAQSHDPEPKVCGPAQARLLLRLGLRGKRDAIGTLKLERRACKVRGDNDGLAAVRIK